MRERCNHPKPCDACAREDARATHQAELLGALGAPMPGGRAAQGRTIRNSSLRDPDRPRLFAAYTFNVHVPPTLAAVDEEADTLVAKLNDAFDKLDGAARTLLAEIDPAITVRMEDA
jgi:hypothetical protein